MLTRLRVSRRGLAHKPIEASTSSAQAFDGDPQTKWLDVGGGSPGQATWLEAALLPTSSPPDCATLTSYSLVSANDAPERDPADFVLEGCCAGSERPPEDGTPARAAGCWQRGGDWRVLDTREGVRFAGRGQRLTFQVKSRSKLACWLRVVVISSWGAAAQGERPLATSCNADPRSAHRDAVAAYCWRSFCCA